MHKKVRLSSLIIIALIVALFLQRGCSTGKISDETRTITTVTDTIYETKTDTVFVELRPIESKPVKLKGSKYIKSSNIDTLSKRFDSLLVDHSMMKIYSDTIKIEDIGFVVVSDTILANKFYGNRSYVKNYKIPTITTVHTIVEKEKPRRQLYAGGNITTGLQAPTNASLGLIYKDRHDRVFQATVGLDQQGGVVYGIGTYWKIKFK